MDGGYFCCRENFEIGGSKTQLIIRDKRIKQQIFTMERFSHSANEQFLFVIIEGTNVRGNFACHIVRICLLFHCKRHAESKQLAFVWYMDLVKHLNSTRDLLGYICLRWSTDNSIDYTNLSFRLNSNQPLACWYDIVEFWNMKCVVKVVRQNKEL